MIRQISPMMVGHVRCCNNVSFGLCHFIALSVSTKNVEKTNLAKDLCGYLK